MEIDWTNSASPISKYHTVHDALWLPKWNKHADSYDGVDDNVKNALVLIFSRLEAIEDRLGIRAVVHCAYRPPAYNTLVGGAKASSHIARAEGSTLIAAIDWHAILPGMNLVESCNDLRSQLSQILDSVGIRMENNGVGATWIHIDTHPVPPGGRRYFIP